MKRRSIVRLSAACLLLLICCGCASTSLNIPYRRVVKKGDLLPEYPRRVEGNFQIHNITIAVDEFRDNRSAVERSREGAGVDPMSWIKGALVSDIKQSNLCKEAHTFGPANLILRGKLESLTVTGTRMSPIHQVHPPYAGHCKIEFFLLDGSTFKELQRWAIEGRANVDQAYLFDRIILSRRDAERACFNEALKEVSQQLLNSLAAFLETYEIPEQLQDTSPEQIEEPSTPTAPQQPQMQQQQQMMGPTIVIGGRTVSGDAAINIKEYGFVVFQSEPRGAEVYVEDNLIGNTPTTKLKFQNGTYNVRVAKEGYTEWERQIMIIEGSTITISAELKPK